MTDRYRYFEKTDSPEVQAFFGNQNTYARAILGALGAPREQLLKRIAQLANAGVGVGPVQIVGDHYVYEKLVPGADEARLYRRPVAPGSPERLLVDPDTLPGTGRGHQTINFFVPSPDGRYVAFGISAGGSEDATIHVVDARNGALLPDAITRGQYGVTSWMPDGSGFSYVRLRKLPADAKPTERYQKSLCFFHVLGRDPERDPAVFGYGLDPNVAFTPDDEPSISLTPASPYALGVANHGVQNELTLYVTTIQSLTTGRPTWRKLLDTDDDVTNFDLKGSTIYLLSHKETSNYRVVALDLASPSDHRENIIVPPSDAVITALGVARDGLYVRSRHGGFGEIARIPLDDNGDVAGRPTAVALPYQGAVDDLLTDPRVDGTTFGLTAWTRSLLYYHVDAAGTISDSKLKPPAPVDESAYSGREVFATSADGTKVPLSIVAAKDLKLDGSHPTYLEAYGAYGITIEPYFSTIRLAWMERSGVYAVCHVRGGGWYGEDWHRAGMIATKQHTIDDYIACARYLIDHQYTAPSRLGGEGTSAGGILIGGAITQHPELFAAVLDVVGVSNALRGEFSPNGPANVPEFGSVKTEAGFKALAAMDAFQHVKDGVAYPAVMLVTGINDPRVPPWEPAKMTARLQAATSSKRPILLRVDYDGGHGLLNASRGQADGLLADEFSFLLWQLGDPAFSQTPAHLFHR